MLPQSSLSAKSGPRAVPVLVPAQTLPARFSRPGTPLSGKDHGRQSKPYPPVDYGAQAAAQFPRDNAVRVGAQQPVLRRRPEIRAARFGRCLRERAGPAGAPPGNLRPRPTGWSSAECPSAPGNGLLHGYVPYSRPTPNPTCLYLPARCCRSGTDRVRHTPARVEAW